MIVPSDIKNIINKIKYRNKTKILNREYYCVVLTSDIDDDDDDDDDEYHHTNYIFNYRELSMLENCHLPIYHLIHNNQTGFLPKNY